jgi:heme exporter protein B
LDFGDLSLFRISDLRFEISGIQRDVVMAHLWWIFHKDLVTEFRSRRVWPMMLLLGVIVGVVFSLEMDLLPDQKQRLVGGLLWLAIYFAGLTALDRSFAGEREDGCWEGLRLYPVSPTTIYLAKLAANATALAVLQGLLIPLFLVLAQLPITEHLGALLLVAALGNLGLATAGTLLSALASGLGRSGTLLAVLALPLMIPVVLAAAEATRLLVAGQLDAQWWRWVQLLGAFVVVFFTAGVVLFEYAIED